MSEALELMRFGAMVLASALFGRWLSIRLSGRIGPMLKTSSGRLIVVFGAFAGWLLVTLSARWYCETDLPLWAIAEKWAHTGKWYAFIAGVVGLCTLTLRMPDAGSDRRRRVAVAAAGAVLVALAVYRSFPAFVSLGDGRRDEHGFLRQAVEREYACGPVALGNCLERFHAFAPFTERELARVCRTTVEGTPRSHLVRAGRLLGLSVECKRSSAREVLESREPAIVSISTLPGLRHATLFVSKDGDSVRCIDPAYGLWTTKVSHFEQILYGKIIRFESANVAMPLAKPLR